MIKISQSIINLSLLSPSSQINLPLILPEPIKISGALNTVALLLDTTKQLEVKNPLEATKQVNVPHRLADTLTVQFELGVDEVGRGPLYGSVVVAAAILPCSYSGEINAKCLSRSNHSQSNQSQSNHSNQSLLANTPLAQLTDSKKLTELKRNRLFPLLKDAALGYVMVEVPASVIDEINILQATLAGMRLACEQLMIAVVKNLDITIHFKLLIDGNKVPDLDWNLLKHYDIGNNESNRHCRHGIDSEAWIKGDGRHSAIAAASVLAKVTRDAQLIKDGLANPDYGLEQHKGYPTKTHLAAIKKWGVLPQHRRSSKPVRQALLTPLTITE